MLLEWKIKPNWFDVVLRNKTIIQNYENELKVINEKIKEYERNIKNTKEYSESIRLNSKL